jgi:tetratricopeptide (TPR) repeat protein
LRRAPLELQRHPQAGRERVEFDLGRQGPAQIGVLGVEPPSATARAGARSFRYSEAGTALAAGGIAASARGTMFSLSGGGASMKQGFARALGGVSLVVALTLAMPVSAQSLGICFTGSGKAAIHDCTRKINLGRLESKALAIAYYNRGFEYKENTDQFDLAIEDFNRALRINPSYTSAYMHRGDAYRRAGNFERAIADFDRALQLDPKNKYREYATEGRDKAREKIKN